MKAKSLFCLAAALTVLGGCGSQIQRRVRPTHAMFNREERMEVYERALQAVTAVNNERILFADRDGGIITTEGGTLRLSPSGALTYVRPLFLHEDDAVQAERANSVFIDRILTNDLTAREMPRAPSQAAQSSVIWPVLIGLGATAAFGFMVYELSH